LFAQIVYNYLTNDLLLFLLYPISSIVEFTTGVPFNYFSEYGFVQIDGLVRINKTCSGFIFLNVLLAISYLTIHLGIRSKKTPLKNIVLSCGIVFLAYLTCLITNSSRIILGIKTKQFSIGHNWFPNNYIHEITGILYFFISSILFLLLIQKIQTKWNN
jgi:exosortase K